MLAYFLYLPRIRGLARFLGQIGLPLQSGSGALTGASRRLGSCSRTLGSSQEFVGLVSSFLTRPTSDARLSRLQEREYCSQHRDEQQCKIENIARGHERSIATTSASTPRTSPPAIPLYFQTTRPGLPSTSSWVSGCSLALRVAISAACYRMNVAANPIFSNDFTHTRFPLSSRPCE